MLCAGISNSCIKQGSVSMGSQLQPAYIFQQGNAITCTGALSQKVGLCDGKTSYDVSLCLIRGKQSLLPAQISE